MGCCSGGSWASSASRWIRRGRSFLALGRGASSGRGGRGRRSRRSASPVPSGAFPAGRGRVGRCRSRSSPSGRGRAGPAGLPPLGLAPSGRPPPGRPPDRSGRSGRSDRSGRTTDRPLGVQVRRPRSIGWVVSTASSPGDPTIGRRSGSRRSPLVGKTGFTVIPSMSISASARRTSPMPAPGGRSLPSSTPLGWRAPAARHVQLPSGRSLVSSTAIRGDTGCHATRLAMAS
ncbi:hypothetical protein BH20ACT1_BH20ACT1_00760 [soil metagenome]